MYKIGEKSCVFFFQWGGGRASWIYKSQLDWTGLFIFPLYHVSSCFLVLPILQASLQLTLKMTETQNLRVRSWFWHWHEGKHWFHMNVAEVVIGENSPDCKSKLKILTHFKKFSKGMYIILLLCFTVRFVALRLCKTKFIHVFCILKNLIVPIGKLLNAYKTRCDFLVVSLCTDLKPFKLNPK